MTDALGVCLLRVEVEDRGLLITIRTSRDVEDRAVQACRVVATVDDALALVREFLLAAAAPGSGPAAR